MTTPAHRAALCTGLLILAAGGCDHGATEPPVSGPLPGFAVVAAPGGDTVMARPSRSLVLLLRDATGAARPHATVVLRSLGRGANPRIVFGPVTGFGRDSISLTTDDRGRVDVAISFWAVAGAAGVIASAPDVPVTDTIRFDVRPGAAARVAILPRDTAVTLGADAPISITVRDQWGNVRPEIPDVQADALIRVLDGRVTGVVYGRARIVAQFGAIRDTGSVAVVPPGRIAGFHAAANFALFVMNTDGSGTNPWVATVNWMNGTVHWSADHRHLLASLAPSWLGQFEVTEVSTSDGSTRPIATSPLGTHQLWPAYSADGQWIYYVLVPGTADYGTGVGALQRMRADGSGVESLVPAPATGPGWSSPAPSPSGDRVAYVGGAGLVFVRRIADGATTTIPGLAAYTVRWSPSGDRLVTSGLGGLHVVNADGSGDRMLRASRDERGFAAWSPDGAWVVWNGPTGLEMVQVDSGLVVPLPFLRSYPIESAWGFSWTTAP